MTGANVRYRPIAELGVVVLRLDMVAHSPTQDALEILVDLIGEIAGRAAVCRGVGHCRGRGDGQ